MLQALANGLLTGAMYGVSALGLSLIYGVLDVVNFAHGALIMIGMYVSYWLWAITKLDVYIILFPTLIIMFIIGVLLQILVIKPVIREKGSHINAIFATTCVGLILENLTLLLFGPNYKVVDTPIKTLTYNLGETIIIAPKLFGAVIAIVLTILLHLLLKKTYIGRAIRATAQNKEAALTIGVNTEQTFGIAFGIGCALAAVAGTLFLPMYYVSPTVGHSFSTKSFIIVVLGGMGSIYGAMLGGLVVGLVEAIASLFMRNTLVEIMVFAIFVLFLFLKPHGLLGRKGY
mgnify:CR=1 FL=1